MMDLPLLAWLALAALAYLLVTAVLATAAGQVKFETERHNIIVAARRRRAEYLQMVAERQGRAAAEAEAKANVDVVDDDEAEDDADPDAESAADVVGRTGGAGSGRRAA